MIISAILHTQSTVEQDGSEPLADQSHIYLNTMEREILEDSPDEAMTSSVLLFQ